jgi:hypothetical protein
VKGPHQVGEGTYLLLDSPSNQDPAEAGALDAAGRLRILPASFWAGFTQLEIATFAVRHALYCIPTTELVLWLLKELGSASAIEIGAGTGVLARALGIAATDSHQQETPEMVALYTAMDQPVIRYGDDVHRLDAETAIRRFKPDVVLGTWITHRYRADEEWRGGNAYGVREEYVIARARYIHVGNEAVHRNKPVLDRPHRSYRFPWLVSRAMNGTPDFIAVWERGA